MFNLNGITVATLEFHNGISVIFSPSDVANLWDVTVVSDKTAPISFLEKSEQVIRLILSVCSVIKSSATEEEITNLLQGTLP
jgi:hypothetical protein